MIIILPIYKNLTTVNFVKGRSDTIKYIVIHYTSNDGDTAYGNTCWFKYNNRGASAHYFIDEDNIYQCVSDQDTAWHCGTLGAYTHPECRNGNSIGIELCSRKDSEGNYYFKQKTVDNTIELVKHLMSKYNIPVSNVIRHHDVVSSTPCPAPFVEHPDQWDSFKSRLSETSNVFKQIYRVAQQYENGKYINQKGAFIILDNAKRCCDKNKGTCVFNNNGKKIYPASLEHYKIVIDTDVLNVRSGPGINYEITTTVKKNEVYTIVAEVVVDNTIWGQLKSGAGYICLTYTSKL